MKPPSVLLWYIPLILWCVLTAPGEAVELSLQTANDTIFGSSDHPDDLYTSAVAVDLHFARHRWTLGERMFTDRERGLRFDETFLEANRELPEWRGWHAEIGAGVLRVGNGLLGEGVQNEVHRWVGSDRVELPYVDDTRWFATGRLRLDRVLAATPRAALSTRLEALAVPDFQSSIRASLAADMSLGGGVALRAGLGARSAKVESSLLEERVSELAATWELGLAWRDLTLRYSFNDHGTETGHLSLMVKVGGESSKFRYPRE